MSSSLQNLVTDIGGAVSSLFSSEGNAAQAKDFQGAATLAEQNAQLTAESTKIQELQESRTVAQSLGTTQADVAGAGFTMSGSALDIMKASAQQGSLAKSLINMQGAITENSYAAQAGAYSGAAKAANEASTAGTIGAIGSIGGALVSGTGQLASAGNTVKAGYNYVTSLFSGSGDTTGGISNTVLDSQQALEDSQLGYTGEFSSITDSQLLSGAETVDTSGIGLGSTLSSVTSGIEGFVSDAAASVGAGVTDAIASAAGVAADVGSAVAGAASAAGDALGIVGDVIAAALSVICTAFFRRGMVSRSTWLGAQRYGQALHPIAYEGYIKWAAPIAHQIEKNAWFAQLMAPIFIPPVNEMAILMGFRNPDYRTIYGVISHRVLLSLSWVVGYAMKGIKYEART